MKKDIIVTAKTVEDAAQNGAAQLGVSREDVEIEVLEEPKKGFLGMGAAPAKVKVTYILKPLEAARNFIETLMADLGITAEIQIHDDGDGESLITIEGEGASILIGHHGDTLEAFQYLVNLAANKKDDEDRQYTRITVNIENYREKREETLRKLAAKMAAKVKKSGRNIALEPMNAYERRIIHAEIQKIEGVSTNSVGAEGNRRVVIFPEGEAKPTEARPERKPRPRREKPAFDKGDKRTKSFDKAEKRTANTAEKTEKSDVRKEQPRKDYSAYKRPEGSRPAPRKIEKAKDLDSYFAKLKEFSSNNPQ
ncbi:MAG: protein jag [Clostridia bacterium]|nr:protein jag [Clostridia bacterium]